MRANENEIQYKNLFNRPDFQIRIIRAEVKITIILCIDICIWIYIFHWVQ